MLRRAGAARSLRLRYEDFVAAPRTTIEAARALTGEPSRTSPFVDEHTVTLGVNHTIAGNPSRFSTGTLVLEDRSDWREGQSRAERWITTAIALPFLRRYGYGPARRRPA